MRNVVISCCVALVACVPGVSIGQTGACPPVDLAELQTYSVKDLTGLWHSYNTIRKSVDLLVIEKTLEGNYHHGRESILSAQCEIQFQRVERVIRAKGGEVPFSKESK